MLFSFTCFVVILVTLPNTRFLTSSTTSWPSPCGGKKKIIIMMMMMMMMMMTVVVAVVVGGG